MRLFLESWETRKEGRRVVSGPLLVYISSSVIDNLSVSHFPETHLLLRSIATTTRVCQTDTHRRPDPNGKLDNAENQNDHGECHLFVIAFPVSPAAVIVTFVSIYGNC